MTIGYCAGNMPSIVSKAESASIPIIGSIVLALQSILVDRNDPKSKQHTIKLIKQRSEDSRWGPILIFPEGTTTNGKSLITFKHGAFEPGLPIQPIFMKYSFKYFDPTYAIGVNAAMLCFQMMCQFVNHVTVTFLPTYYPNEDEKQDAQLYANNVRKYMIQK